MTTPLAGLLLTLLAAGETSSPRIVPQPRVVAFGGDRFALAGATIVAAEPAEAQVARVLAAEAGRLWKVDLPIVPAAAGRAIELALLSTERGKALLAAAAGKAAWPPARNRTEGYILEVAPAKVVVLAETARGLLYGCQTLVQLAVPAEGRPAALAAARIVDWPQLPFRGLHVCIFPNTELPAIRQAILVAARYKCNAVVIEPWAAIRSKKRPETAYEHAYTADEVRPIVRMAQALGVEVIPMLNSWGHASGMRSRSFEHVVLDRFPQYRGLYEPDGWSFCLTNPEIYPHLFDRYGELLELFGPAKYFHAGMDEAWGHLGLTESAACRGENPRRALVQHLQKICGYFGERKIQVMMWHDMFIQRNHPQLGRLSPANSVPPIDSHLALDELPRDVIIAAWNYDERREWPVPKYFHDKGYPVVVCPWKSKMNTASLLNTAKRLDLLGVLATTWDSLDVSLPSVAQAAVLAWTPPGYDLKEVPFDEYVGGIRRYPIDALPKLESTLEK